MPPPYAAEYTDELNQGFMANLLNQSSNAEAANVGEARKEGDAGGLVGQAATGSRIGAAVDSEDRAVGSAVANFNLDVAGKKYSERMTNEREAFSDTQRQKTEDFQEKMTNLGYQRSVSDREAQNAGSLHAAERGTLTGTAVGLLTPSASFMGMGVNPHANSGGSGGQDTGMSGGNDQTGSYRQQSGMAGFGEGDTDLSGNSWRF